MVTPTRPTGTDASSRKHSAGASSSIARFVWAGAIWQYSAMGTVPSRAKGPVAGGPFDTTRPRRTRTVVETASRPYHDLCLRAAAATRSQRRRRTASTCSRPHPTASSSSTRRARSPRRTSNSQRCSATTRPRWWANPSRFCCRNGSDNAMSHIVTSYTARPSRRAMGPAQTLFGRRQNGQEFPVDISLNYYRPPEGGLRVDRLRSGCDGAPAD